MKIGGSFAPQSEVIRWICARFVTGKMPGTIGTRMPSARRRSRKRKKSSLW